MKLTLEQIKELCREYDKEHGMHWESPYEGLSVYQFIFRKLTNGLWPEENEDDWEESLKSK